MAYWLRRGLGFGNFNSFTPSPSIPFGECVMPKKVKVLRRYFKERRHAEEFISGQIRIGRLDVYRIIEGARRDTEEGTASFTWNTPALRVVLDAKTKDIQSVSKSLSEGIAYKGFTANPQYILCVGKTRAKIKIMGRKFGKFYVDITDPERLRERLNVQWQKLPGHLGEVRLRKVKYTRGEILKADLYLIPPPDTEVTQKGRNYRGEHEYRYILTGAIGHEYLHEYMVVNIGNTRGIIRGKINKA